MVKLEKRLREMTDRVSELELALRDSDDEIIKYQQRIHQLASSFNSSNNYCVDFNDVKRDSAIDSIYKPTPSPTIESNSLLSPSPTSSPAKWSRKLSTLNLKSHKQKILSPTIAFYLLTRFLD